MDDPQVALLRRRQADLFYSSRVSAQFPAYFIATHVQGNATYAQRAIVHRPGHAYPCIRPDLVSVECQDRPVRVLPGGEGAEGEPPAAATDVHHEAELVDGAYLLEGGQQLVLRHISGHTGDEHLASPGGGGGPRQSAAGPQMIWPRDRTNLTLSCATDMSDFQLD
ncbi:hypothetical protein CEXT_147611 [Caerostris extrusa]|uniref:Uncharacterized protein n=1 Tax=Caerostris extrusa TaxID=172846 RepID=A0AAV4PDJ3_CAEEX|nr:hypothetical protein CEXT_147611 [Caerostris extrusa]